MFKKKLLKFFIAVTVSLSCLPVFNVSANDLNETGIVDVSAVSDVSWCGNIPGYGTYPQRAISKIYLKYSQEIDKTKLNTSSFKVVDMAYQEEELIVEAIEVSGNTIRLDVSTQSSAGVLTAPGGNFRRYVSDFTVVQNDDILNMAGEVISPKDEIIDFHRDDITNIASDEFKDYIVKSENSDNNIYVKYYLPENYNENKNYPMVVHHTGGGQHYRTDSPDEQLYGKDNFGVELDIDLVPKTFSVNGLEDTIVVTIQCLANNKPENYSAGKDINQIVHYFIENFAVDKDRVYAIGNSQGGIDLSDAIYFEPELYAAYLPCNTSIVSGDKSSQDTLAYKKSVEYCQAYVDNEVAIWFHRGENDFTGPYSEVTIPYNILVELYQKVGYSENDIAELVKQTNYSNADFEAIGSKYYHGATGLMCLNQEAINWLYKQTKNDNTETLVHLVDYKQTKVYQYDAKNLMDEYTTNVTYTPSYIIFPDQSLNAKQADQLLEELGIINHLNEYATQAFIINPKNTNYSQEDVEVYLDILDKVVGPNPNVKIIGIKNGATFVNQYINQYTWGIAGIMLYDGKGGLAPKYSIPTYISQSENTVVEAYKKANQATNEIRNNNLITYVNPNNAYEMVVNQTKDESLMEAFQNAWKNIFSNNARVGNIGGTFYSMTPSMEREFQYVDFVTPESLNMNRYVIAKDLNGNGQNSLWYEYLPQQTLKAKEGSVPVVLMLHGNNNDPRTQFESSGWAQIASGNGIILIEPEWQGSKINGYEFEAMTANDSSTKENDIITMLNAVFEKYPQIDQSRVYVEGLSRGGLNAIDLGLTNTEVFAGVGIHSSGIAENLVDLDAVSKFAAENASKYDMPVYYVTGSKDHNRFVPFYNQDADTSAYNAIKLFQQLNNMEVIERSNLKAEDNVYFGMKLNDYGEIANNGLCKMYGGTLSNDRQVSISLNVVDDWGHWNYEFNAKMMWDFFKQYQRDSQTKEIIVNNSNKEPQQPIDNKTPSSESSATLNTAVKTGDQSMLSLYIQSIIMVLSIGSYVYRKRRY